jgi:CRISPR/Cas system CMR-associated protein Cmr5 small subunit
VQVWNLKFVCPEQMLNKDKKINDKYKSYIEKLLPKPKPNNELLLIVLPSATLAQNAMLYACTSFS